MFSQNTLLTAKQGTENYVGSQALAWEPHLEAPASRNHKETLMPRSRYRVMHQQAPHFMTMTINYWLPVFTRTETVNVILDSWRYLQQQADFKLYGYVILENHLHCVAASKNLSRDIL